MENPLKTCPVCRSENNPEFRFCKQCGTLLGNPPADSGNAGDPLQNTPPAPGAYPGNPPQNTPPAPGVYPGTPPQNTPPAPGAYPGNPQQYAPPAPGAYPGNPQQYTPPGPYAGNQPPYGSFNYAQGAAPYAPPPPLPDIEGIPADLVAAFVGEKSNYYVGQFSKLDQTNSKTSWNWAAFLLAFFLGPIGAAIWFLRRKMVKISMIFVGLFVLLSGLTLFSNLQTADILAEYLRRMFSMIERGLEPDVTFYTSEFTMTMIIGGAVSLFSLVLSIVVGLFANFLYKNHCVKTIHALSDQTQVTPGMLSQKGGISALWLILLGLCIVSAIASFIVVYEPIYDVYMDFIQRNLYY